MEQLYARLAKLDPRLLLGCMILIVGLLAFEGWVLVIRKPLVEYRQLAAARASLAATVGALGHHAGELTRLTAELKRLSERLSGELQQKKSKDQMAAALLSELDRSADRDGVMLTGVKPGAITQVQGFEQLAYDVSARGKYLMLCEWLLNFEHTLGQNATVTEFQMQSADAGREVALTLKVALYLPLQAGVAAP
jgi:Tfp pilus assembly protein PilO